MTEAEWLKCTKSTQLLRFLRKKATTRRLICFVLSCARRHWQLLQSCNPDSVAIYQSWEEYADNLTSIEQVAAIYEKTTQGNMTEAPDPYDLALWDAGTFASRGKSRRVESHAQVAFIHDIFGNPFRAVTLDRRRLPPTVTSLATAAYEERALPSGELDQARLVVLADALEEAGCQEVEILNHLRGPGPHVRGCWVLDLLLGKN